MDPVAPARPVQGCKFHPPLTAKAHCKSCGAPLCNLCIKFINGRVLCETCAPARASGYAPGQAPAASVPNPGSSGRLFATTSSARWVMTGSGATPSQAPGASAGPPAPAVPHLPSVPASSTFRAASISQNAPISSGASGASGVIRTQEETAAMARSNIAERLERRREEGRSNRIQFCKKHPGALADKKCEHCGSMVCADCISLVRNTQLCSACALPGGSSRVLKVAVPDVLPEAKRTSRRAVVNENPLSFMDRLAEVFFYPFKGAQKFLLLGGPPLLWVAFKTHWALGVVMGAVIALWMMKIVRYTALDIEHESTCPALNDAAHDILKPFGFLLLAAFTALAPALVYLPLGNPDLIGYAFRQTTGLLATDDDPAAKPPTVPPTISAHPGEESAPVERSFLYRVDHDSTLKILLSVAMLIFPLGLAMVSIFPHIDALSPPFILNSMLRLAPYYILMLFILALGYVPAYFMLGTSESYTGPLGLGAAGLMVYFSIAGLHTFGNLYAADHGAFNWVGLPPAKA